MILLMTGSIDRLADNSGAPAKAGWRRAVDDERFGA